MPQTWSLRNLCNNTEIKIEKSVLTVGRHKSHDIECRNSAISRNHAEILTVGDDLFIKAHASLNGTYLNGRRLDNLETAKLTDKDLLNFGFFIHPLCDQTINHYCYTVISHPITMEINTSQQLLNILEGIDEGESSVNQNNEAKSSPLYSNKDEVIYIDDDDDFELYSQRAFNDRIKSEPVECIEISDCESEGDVYNLDGLKAMMDNIVSVKLEIDEDVNENVAEPCDQNQIGDSNEKPNEIENLNEKNKDIQLNGKFVDRSFITPMKHPKIIITSPHIEVNEKKRRKSVEVNHKGKKQKDEEDKNRKTRRKSMDVDKVIEVNEKGRRKSVELNHKGKKQNDEEDKKRKMRRKSMDVDKVIEVNEKLRRKSVDVNHKAKKQKVENKNSKTRRESMDVDKVNDVIRSLINDVNEKNKRRKSVDDNLNNKHKNGKIKCVDINKLSNGLQEVAKDPNQSSHKNGEFKEPSEIVRIPKKISFRNLENPTPSTSNLNSFKPTRNSTITSWGDVPKDSYLALLKDGARNFIYPKNNNNIKTPQNNLCNKSTKIYNDSMKENSIQLTNFNERPKDPRLNQRNNSTINDLPTISKGNHPVISESTNYQRRNLHSIINKPSFHMVLALLCWNVDWLEECKIVQKPPPIIKNNIVKMCTLFNTYKDYCNVVKPFIMLELWDHLCSGYTMNATKFRSKRFVTNINDVTKHDRYQTLRCIGYLNGREQKDFPKEGDIIMTHLGVKPHNTTKQTALKCLFAYVVSCKKRHLKSTVCTNEISSQFDINLIIKPFPEEILLAKSADAMIITNVTSILRECNALMLLENSQVFKLLLSPIMESFVVKRNEEIVLKAKGLSEKQMLAVQEACTLCIGNSPGLYMIQGPPGTGKTTVIQHIIETLVRLKPDIKILVVAPSNVTVDGILRKLTKDKKREDLVRLGIYESIGSDLHYYFIENIIRRKMTEQILTERPEVRLDFNKLKQRALDLHAKIDEMTNHKKNAYHLIKELKSIDHQINNFAQDYFQDAHYWNTFHKIRKEILMRRNIICTTLNSCFRLGEYGLNIDCCIIDEASQSKETETLIPLSLGIEKIVLIGDPKQLPAVTLSKYAKDLGYGQSLMSRLKKAFISETKQPITMLDLQFRMHPEICLYPSETFYEGMLKTASICNKRGGLDGLAPYYVLNINKNHQANERLENGYYNETEINCVVKLLKAINDTIGHKTDKFYTVGVITPYNNQRKDLLVEIKKLRMPSIQITVNTVDSFQGSEKDIIILSCVRLRANSFLNDEQRLNVSITRARRVLYVVGTNPLFDTCSTLKNLKENAKTRNLYLNLSDVSETILKSIIVRRPQ
ncbi:uncharacterized protein [Onthophagus taurus]|uniref:uncharacterized protein isoform X2 n=1 Tax=Onthophagus taurus TaxID=166361 RepID=UPI0039BE9476